MKKLLTCFFAICIVAPAAIADNGAVSRGVASNSGTAANVSSPRNNASRTSSHAQSQTPGAVRTRSTVSRVFSGRPSASEQKSNSAKRVSARQVINFDNTRTGLDAAVNTVGRNARVLASRENDTASRRAGVNTRPSTASVGGRAIISGTGMQTGSNADDYMREIRSRATSNTARENIAQATERLEQTASLNKSCQEQYNECMDQFCAVIDANQGRCSCSANLSKYTKVEQAVKDANTQLNEVAQRIRYVGLSADEIRAIMTETEAEEALNGTTDTSETRNMLSEIEELIRNPNVSNSSYAGDSMSLDLDIDLDFSSDTADLFSLDFLSTDSATSFSNLRGSDLYNAAKNRCKTVLNQCKDAGATASQITGNYDLAIDKDCIAYERGLTKMNETLVSNVRSANRMLQKARLAVLQNKNQYDAKGCIGALETCMKDDMVCGDNYFKCVDPTKVYIDENGEVVLGQDISKITDFMQNYNNASIDTSFLESAYSLSSVDSNTCAGESGNNGACVAKYLLTKIGTKQSVTDEGLCRPVLDKCQRYTYTSDGEYRRFNDIVVNYMQRAMVNIRAAQRQIISDYASSCMTDIASCYNQQVTQLNSWSSNASVASVYNVMRGACRNVALTCAYAVFSNGEVCSEQSQQSPESCLIEKVSEIFYQSLLCPDNSTYYQGGVSAYNEANSTTEKTGNGNAWVNENCRCIGWSNQATNVGYEAWGASCVLRCPAYATRNSYGSCVCVDGYTMKDGLCVSTTPVPPVEDDDDINQNPGGNDEPSEEQACINRTDDECAWSNSACVCKTECVQDGGTWNGSICVKLEPTCENQCTSEGGTWYDAYGCVNVDETRTTETACEDEDISGVWNRAEGICIVEEIELSGDCTTSGDNINSGTDTGDDTEQGTGSSDNTSSGTDTGDDTEQGTGSSDNTSGGTDTGDDDTSADKTAEQIECENDGGLWYNNNCSMPDPIVLPETEEDCVAAGFQWVNGVCDIRLQT